MNNSDFFGAIHNALVVSTDESRHIGSTESIIGCECTLEFRKDAKGYAQVGVASPHGESFGAFDTEFSEKLTRLDNLGNLSHVYLSALGYTEEEGTYWGEFTIIMFPADQHEVWDTFATLLQEKVSNGSHPNVKLSPKTVALVLDAKGNWCNLQKAPYPKLQSGVYVKKRRGTKDDLLEKARENNRGCVVASYIFWAVVIVVIVFLVWWFLFR